MEKSTPFPQLLSGLDHRNWYLNLTNYSENIPQKVNPYIIPIDT